MLTEAWIIPLSALIITCGTLVFAVITLKGNTALHNTQAIEDILTEIKHELRECIVERTRLERENLMLIRAMWEKGKNATP